MNAWLFSNISGLRAIDDLAPTSIYGKIKVFLNGRWIAICDQLYENVQMLRNFRRMSIIPLFTSISYSVPDKSISIFTDYGRLCRPLYYVADDQQIDFSRKIADYTWQQLLCGDFKKEGFNFKNNAFHALEELYGKSTTMDTAWTTRRAIIDLVDTSETESLLIAHNNVQIVERQKQYTHLELHNSLMFGFMGNQVIFPEHNPLPRNLFSCGQSKQAASVFHTN